MICKVLSLSQNSCKHVTETAWVCVTKNDALQIQVHVTAAACRKRTSLFSSHGMLAQSRWIKRFALFLLSAPMTLRVSPCHGNAGRHTGTKHIHPYLADMHLSMSSKICVTLEQQIRCPSMHSSLHNSRDGKSATFDREGTRWYHATNSSLHLDTEENIQQVVSCARPGRTRNGYVPGRVSIHVNYYWRMRQLLGP